MSFCLHRTLRNLLLLAAPLAAASASAQTAAFQNCYARWSATELTVGNTHFERRWQIRNGHLYATSFQDRDAKKEWLAAPSRLSSPRIAGPQADATVAIHAETGRTNPVEAASLQLRIDIGSDQHLRMKIFPDATGIEEDFTAPANTSTQTDTPQTIATGKEAEANKAKKDNEPALDEFSLQPQHLRLTEVTLRDVTDTHNQLVSTREWMFMNNEEDILARGNIVYVEDVLSGAGLIFLKQSPLPDARAQQSLFDLRMMASDRTVRLTGAGYPFAVLAYSGGRSGRIRALHTYQRQLRVYEPQRDAAFLSNTWGDRNRDARINADFITKEIEAGAKLGVDAVQIDDGWQYGKSMNSAVKSGGVWSGFWANSSHFWDVDPQRFPQGLKPLVQQAATHHMKFGLWYAPDSSDDFANWQRDANRILELWRNEGVLYFKFDSIVMSTPTAEQHVQQMFDRILAESKGAITIDLDVTAGRRPGYFGMIEGGTTFVENRYTDFHRYYPHMTLRNLWQLSEFVDPIRLRMEFLNNTRNTQRYADDPLAPANYTPDALFASVMFSSPLGWFETSSLPPAYIASAAPVIATWKRERERLFRGNIQPIGNAPDGVAWTGFASTDADNKGGYLLLFREANSNAQWTTSLPIGIAANTKLTVLAGTGTATERDGAAAVTIAKPLGYVWLRFDSK
ncbi:alpha-galactosidase [Terriglobus roseus]|uniref:Alpha-galactosidase n=2 Tax=Terriglobus roseus TaxID=392734 RepID=A0A1G7PMN8_9BACT|nr:alpha-galactosidase [Terriglobus roseus]